MMIEQKETYLAGWFDGVRANVERRYANNEMVWSHELAHRHMSIATADGILLSIIKSSQCHLLPNYDESGYQQVSRYLSDNSTIAHEAYATYLGIQDLETREEREKAVSTLPDKYQEYYQIYVDIIDSCVDSTWMKYCLVVAISNFIFSSTAFKAWVDSEFRYDVLLNERMSPDWRLLTSHAWLKENIRKYLLEAIQISSTSDKLKEFKEHQIPVSIDHIDDQTKRREIDGYYCFFDSLIIQNTCDILFREARKTVGITSLFDKISDYEDVVKQLFSKIDMDCSLASDESDPLNTMEYVAGMLDSAVVVEPIVTNLGRIIDPTCSSVRAKLLRRFGSDQKLNYTVVRFEHPRGGAMYGYHFFPVLLSDSIIDEEFSKNSLFFITGAESSQIAVHAQWASEIDCVPSKPLVYLDMCTEKWESEFGISELIIDYYVNGLTNYFYSRSQENSILSTYTSKYDHFKFHAKFYLFKFGNDSNYAMKIGMNDRSGLIMNRLLNAPNLIWTNESDTKSLLSKREITYISILLNAFSSRI